MTYSLFSQWDGFIVTAVKGSVNGQVCQMEVRMDSGGVQLPMVLFSGHEGRLYIWD